MIPKLKLRTPQARSLVAYSQLAIKQADLCVRPGTFSTTSRTGRPGRFRRSCSWSPRRAWRAGRGRVAPSRPTCPTLLVVTIVDQHRANRPNGRLRAMENWRPILRRLAKEAIGNQLKNVMDNSSACGASDVQVAALHSPPHGTYEADLFLRSLLVDCITGEGDHSSRWNTGPRSSANASCTASNTSATEVTGWLSTARISSSLNFQACKTRGICTCFADLVHLATWTEEIPGKQPQGYAGFTPLLRLVGVDCGSPGWCPETYARLPCASLWPNACPAAIEGQQRWHWKKQATIACTKPTPCHHLP